jgi:flagellar biosynthesis/type III secretory pathway protein FliH
MAGIIKASGRETAAPPNPARAFQFDDMGQSYLGDVRSEASKIVAEARREAAQIKAKAQSEGQQAALQAVEATLRGRLDQQLGSVLKAMQQAAQEIAHARQAWQQQWEQQAVELAAAIARRIIRRELDRQPEISLEWIREALQLAAGNGDVVLRVNPEDHATLGDRVTRVAGELSRLGEVRIVADAAISAGGCKVETQFGSIDQQIEAQLARITEELRA